MDKIVWNERLNIGVDAVDKAHANLFRMVGKLTELSEHQSNYKNACKEGLKYLEDYTMKHFSEEEAYMRSIHYRGYEKHKKVHDTFRDQTLVSLKKTLELSDYSRAAAQRFLAVLLGWLTGHIMVEDQAITGEVSSVRIYDNASAASAAALAVCQAMKDMFHIDSELIDTDYNGRSMGMGFFYRLTYDMNDGCKVQILLGAEEQLIRRGIGLIFGIHAMHTSMVEEVSLQIFEQLLHHMGKLFKTKTTYTLYREELLSSDEFRSDFMTRYTCNMLFETRLGHFVFCWRKWEAKHKRQEYDDSKRTHSGWSDR